MRELTKSILSFSWAMPLYGMKQMLNLSVPQDMSRPFGRAADGFGAVTDAMRKEMGPTMRGLFDAGDQIQRGMTDLMFSFFNVQAFDPSSWMRMGSGMMQSSMRGMERGMEQAMPGSTGQGDRAVSRAGDAAYRTAAGMGDAAYRTAAGMTDVAYRTADATARTMDATARATDAAFGGTTDSRSGVPSGWASATPRV